MTPNIEDYPNPQIGDFFMVRTVRFKRNGGIFCWPVVDHVHVDGQNELPEPHYHIDWRFMPEEEVMIQRDYLQKIFAARNSDPTYNKKAEYFAPIMGKEVMEEYFTKYQYLRDFDFPANSFGELHKQLLEKGCKMKKMRCPHHGTNLVSCRVVDGVVTCPQHGLKWNVKTGELVL